MPRQLLAPTSIEEALSMLSTPSSGTAVIAGGTDLVVAARQGRRALPERLISILEIKELRRIELHPNGSISLGSLVSHAEICSSPLIRDSWTALADASALVGSPATRNAGTIGGNLANASPAMESGAPLFIFDAAINLCSARRSRSLSFDEYHLGPGRTATDTDEILTSVTLPSCGERVGSSYMRLEYRRAMEIAIVGAAARVTLDGAGAVADLRLALAAVAPTIVRSPAAEDELRGHMPTESNIRQAVDLIDESINPISDVRGTSDYRRAMAREIAARAIHTAAARARGEVIPIPANRSRTKIGVEDK